MTRKPSEREIDVLHLLAQGYNNTEIVARPFFSEGTAKNYVGALFTKWNVEDRSQTSLYVQRNGLIKL